jgi:hypothetical protein
MLVLNQHCGTRIRLASGSGSRKAKMPDIKKFRIFLCFLKLEVLFGRLE